MGKNIVDMINASRDNGLTVSGIHLDGCVEVSPDIHIKLGDTEIVHTDEKILIRADAINFE